MSLAPTLTGAMFRRRNGNHDRSSAGSDPRAPRDTRDDAAIRISRRRHHGRDGVAHGAEGSRAADQIGSKLSSKFVLFVIAVTSRRALMNDVSCHPGARAAPASWMEEGD